MIDWAKIEETDRVGGGYRALPSGGYVCTITKASFETTKKGKPALVILWDVAEGDCKGFFEDEFYANKPFKHNDYILLDKPTGILKHKVNQLDKSNDGLRCAEAAGVILDRDESQERRRKAVSYLQESLVGKSIGLVLQERKYTYNGRDQSEWSITDYVTPEDVRAGRFDVPDTIDDREAAGDARGTQAVASDAPAPIEVADDDIPF